MPFHSHRKLGAWLGLLAIWLGLLMPIASQSIQRHQDEPLSLSFCFPDGKQDVQAPAPGQSHSEPSHAWQACGYCGLLAQHLPLPHAVVLRTDAPARPVAAIAAAGPVVDVPAAYPPAFPRAPPFLFS